MVNWTLVLISFVMFIVAAEVGAVGIAGALIIAVALAVLLDA